MVSLVSIRNPADSPCIATLHFGDPAFLPITWIFEPIVCEGATVVSFNVPRDAPNGEALVEWYVLCLDTLVS